MAASWKKAALAAALSALAGACAGPQIPEAGTPAAELYLAKCTSCHSWPHPQRHTTVEWEHYLGLMEKNMQNAGIDFPENEKQTIRDYLMRNSR
jgi:hypothetical protein